MSRYDVAVSNHFNRAAVILLRSIRCWCCRSSRVRHWRLWPQQRLLHSIASNASVSNTRRVFGCHDNRVSSRCSIQAAGVSPISTQEEVVRSPEFSECDDISQTKYSGEELVLAAGQTHVADGALFNRVKCHCKQSRRYAATAGWCCRLACPLQHTDSSQTESGRQSVCVSGTSR